MMNAIELLESQHREVEALFEKLEKGKAGRPKLLTQLANSLAAHMAIEQDIFYPAVKEVDSDLVNESYEEHSLAEVALKRLLATEPDDEAFDARVTALKELIEHHVEEEEQELFPSVEKVLEAKTLEKLGSVMEPRFDEVLKNGFEAAVPKGMSKTSADVSKAKSAA
jgi:hemerythrin-like domain-containing protein